MNDEFKKSKKGLDTVYTLESATSGGTSAGAVASVSSPVGGVQRRASLVTSEEKKDAPKPRNFVAKNAKMGGAGAHKDKKKAQKQGDQKHKKPFAEDLKQRLDVLKQKINENSDLAAQLMATARSLGMNPRLRGTPDQERERTQQMMAQRAKERDAAGAQAASDDAKNLPQLKAEYEEMKKKYEALGGSNWQYADREQNLSSAEREARSMEPALRNLSSKIARAEKAGVAEGEKNPHTSALGKALHRDLSKEKKASPQQVQRNKERWAQRQADKEQGVAEGSDYFEHLDNLLEDWQSVNNKDKTDGMSRKAVKAYRRENPGSKLKTAVTTKPSKLKKGGKAAKRRKSFCARMSGNKGPMKDKKGRPTPKAKALARWNCNEDAYMAELAGKVAEKLDPQADVDVWVQDFQKADPNKYHQFKNKTPQKKAQMANAAHYAANEPSKK